MEQVYALGISCIQFLQERFSDCSDYFHLVNALSNPYYVVSYGFPLLAAVDSVFAAQFLVCIGFGNWLNAVMKWWLLEDRPYWWVRETTYYTEDNRPTVQQFAETCETGPGSPSGHTATAASLLILIVMWIAHVMHDRNIRVTWWRMPVYALMTFGLLSVMAARVFVAAHFPHQVLLGGLVGVFISPFLCIYVVDPYVFKYGAAATRPVKVYMWWHVVYALLSVVVAALTYLALLAAGMDPMWTVHLAFRWCSTPSWIRVSSSPLFALVAAAAALLGAAITLTPSQASYRHDTKNRSLIIGLIASGLIYFTIKHFEDNICGNHAGWYYGTRFFLDILKCLLYLRFVPYLAMWPYSGTKINVHEKKD